MVDLIRTTFHFWVIASVTKKFIELKEAAFVYNILQDFTYYVNDDD